MESDGKKPEVAGGSKALYLRPRIIAMLFLGFSSGLPLALTGGTLLAWLRKDGISVETIGLFAGVGTPYAIKFLWAPLVDNFRLPLLNRLMGRRRSWIFLTQLLTIVAMVGLGRTSPAGDIHLMVYWAVALAAISATQDIVIDAFRIESLGPDEQAAGVTLVLYGYRVGMLASGAGALYLADQVLPWSMVYVAMAALMPVGIMTTLLVREPPKPDMTPGKSGNPLIRTVIEPFLDFIRRYRWPALAILLFAVIFKLGNNLADTMTNPFLLDIGFSLTEIAGVTKLFGLVPTLAGFALGGSLVAFVGQFRSLMICGVLAPLSVLGFAALAVIGPDITLLAAVIAVEHLAFGMGATVFIAYLSTLCSPAFAATQYALLSALAAVARTWLSMMSGYMQADLGWFGFFVATALLALPGLLLLVWLRRMGAVPDHRIGDRI